VKFKRSIEALVTPVVDGKEDPVWVDVKEVRVKIAGHEVIITSSKEGCLVIDYTQKIGRKVAETSVSMTKTGAVLKVTP